MMISFLNCAKVMDDGDKLPKLCLQRSWMMVISCLNCVSAKVVDDGDKLPKLCVCKGHG